MKIGLIDLGNMGGGMAHNLLMYCKDSGDEGNETRKMEKRR